MENPNAKNIFIQNNNIKKNRQKNYMSSINIPYKMSDILKPLLGKIVELPEENQNQNEEENG